MVGGHTADAWPFAAPARPRFADPPTGEGDIRVVAADRVRPDTGVLLHNALLPSDCLRVRLLPRGRIVGGSLFGVGGSARGAISGLRVVSQVQNEQAEGVPLAPVLRAIALEDWRSQLRGE